MAYNDGGGGGGGGSLPSNATNLLTHLVYNPDTDKLEADVPISTTLNSFYLGEQHSISSGGENVFFTNHTADIDWFPSWSGVLNQSIPANRGITGIIANTTRLMGTRLLDTEFFGPVHPTVVVDDLGAFAAPFDISVHGTIIRMGEVIDPTDKMIFNLYAIQDGQPASFPMYSQLTTGNTLAVDDMFEFWFDHPLDLKAGAAVYQETLRVKETGESTFVQVYAAAAEPTFPYATLRHRPFQDLASLSEPTVIDRDYTVQNGEALIVDTSNDRVQIDVPDGCNYFTVADYNNTWTDTRRVRVDVGTDAAVFGLDARGLKYEFKREGTNFIVRTSTNEYKEALAI